MHQDARKTLTLWIALAVAVLAGCESDPPVDPATAWERAVARAAAEDERGALRALRVALATDPTAGPRALLEPAFGTLRDREAFRTALHDALVAHRVSQLQLAPEGEPGEWIEVEGRVIDERERPVPGAVVRLYVTDTEGRYHPTLEGDRTPRLFGTLVTDDTGRFTFRTVRPGSYPGTRDPRHVHLMVTAGERRFRHPRYVTFDDDPLLFEPGNEEPRDEALRIRMRTAEGAARGELVLPIR